MARTPEENAYRKLEMEAATCDDEARFKQLLRQIRRTGLWRRAYQTWNEYLAKRWDIYDDR